MIIGLNKILGTQTINLETGEIIDNSVIDCFGGGGGGKGGGGGSTRVIYQESPQSIAYREAQLQRERERTASENKIKADASAVKADWESRSGMQSVSRSGTYNAPTEQNVGLLAEATRKVAKGSEAEKANTAKTESSNQTIKGGSAGGDISSGLGNVVEEDESGLFFKKKKA